MLEDIRKTSFDMLNEKKSKETIEEHFYRKYGLSGNKLWELKKEKQIKGKELKDLSDESILDLYRAIEANEADTLTDEEKKEVMKIIRLRNLDVKAAETAVEESKSPEAKKSYQEALDGLNKALKLAEEGLAKVKEEGSPDKVKDAEKTLNSIKDDIKDVQKKMDESKVKEEKKSVEDIIAGIKAGTDEYFSYGHFDTSNMADYTLMSSTISDMESVYGISPEEGAEVVQALTHKHVRGMKAESKVKEATATLEPEVIEFLQDHWVEFINAEDAIKNLVAQFKISNEDAKDYLEAVKSGQGKLPGLLPENKKLKANLTIALAEKQKLEDRIKQLTENYIKDVKEKEEELRLVNMLRNSFNDEITKLKENVADLDSLALKHIKVNGKLKEDNKKLDETVHSYVKENQTLKETHEKAIKDLEEKHKKELIECYTNTRLSSMGLKLPGNIRTLFESCKDEMEVEALIGMTRDMIRESTFHSSPISEISVTHPIDPVQADLVKRVGNAMKGMGVA